MSIFSTFLEVQFTGLKSILFYPENQKSFLSGFFGSKKKHMKKRSIFWQKPWTNRFGKGRFLSTLWELYLWDAKSIIFYPEYQRMFLSGFFGSKKNIWKKGRFFDKNHGLTLLQKSDFFSTFWELHFWGPKNFFFYPEYQKMFLYGFLLKKKHIRKRSIFWQKPWTNPFAKCRFF